MIEVESEVRELIYYCLCPKLACERHGDCQKCVEYHKGDKKRPYCRRPKNPIIRLIKRYF
jgi:hypothetical protein